MKKLWEKKVKPDQLAESYTSGENVLLDNQLIIYDVWGSVAHTKMLTKIGFISQSEFQSLLKQFNQIIKLYQQGRFQIVLGDEDVHTKVEQYLTEKLGVLGEKIHTGRSRNDQVLVDLRLFTKDKLINIIGVLLTSIIRLIDKAKQYEFIAMPGYTHMQKAMPSSVGLWLGNVAESLLDDLQLLQSAYDINDQSPLGSGAAYGVSLPIDRELTAKYLGFSKVQNNVLYCQNSRCKIQLAVVQSFVQIMLTLSRFAEDLLLFTTSEFNFFAISEAFCTGSSIMPQKKNLDIMEILRARSHQMIQYQQVIAAIGSGLPSGYNTDYQETKGAYLHAFKSVKESLEIVTATVESLTPNIDVLQKSCTSELNATHAAYQLVKKGIPFRAAYKKIGMSLDKLPKYSIKEILMQTNQIGAPGNLRLKEVKEEMRKREKWWEKEKRKFILVMKKLLIM